MTATRDSAIYATVTKLPLDFPPGGGAEVYCTYSLPMMLGRGYDCDGYCSLVSVPVMLWDKGRALRVGRGFATDCYIRDLLRPYGLVSVSYVCCGRGQNV